MADKSFLVACLALVVCFELADAGVSYIRWGRTVCPAGEVPLYKGYVTTRHYKHKSGSNYLCSDETPKFVRGQAGWQGSTGRLFGVEYEISPQQEGLFKTDNLNGGKLYNQDAVCVRCYVQDSSDVFVLPGRDDCHSSGYQLEYKGFLVSERYNVDHVSSNDFICVDEAPEGRIGGTGNNDQGLFYPVEYGCGSLPCNPYSDGMEATCAVCSY